MGMGFRIFILDDSKIIKIPLSKFERLWGGDENEKIPQYAGKRIRIASIIVGIENRIPVEVLHMDCLWIKVDKQGRFDQNEIRQMEADAMKGIDLLPIDPKDEDTPSNVIDASSFFAQKRYQNKYKWTPTEAELIKMAKLIFE